MKVWIFFNQQFFQKKKAIFSKIIVKSNFWGAWPFLRKQDVGRQKWTWPFLSQKTHTGWIKAENRFWGHIFPHISDSIGPIVSKNNDGLPMGGPARTMWINRAVVPLTENKKYANYAKYGSSKPIVLDRTFLYTNNGSTSEYACLWNTTTMKEQYGTRVLHLTLLVE